MSNGQLTYYRALITDEHLHRWRQKLFSSFHHVEPPEWWQIWQEHASIDPIDYPLDSVLGVFSHSARATFVRLVQEKPAQSTWTKDERRRVSELAGICAFETPAAAWKYGLIDGEHDWRRFVEFTGQEICRTPEAHGLVVKVSRTMSPVMSARIFRARHGL